MNLPIPFRHSIQLRLAAALSAALLLAALLAGGFAFYDSYRSTNKLQDDLLRQIAAHIDPNRLPENTESQRDAHIRIQTPAGDRARAHDDDDDDDDDHITLPTNLPEGLHTFQEPDSNDTYRAYIRHTPQGPVAVLQENDFREDLFIELLRSRLAVAQLGATVLDGLVGDITIPKHLTGNTVQWVDENGSATESNATFGQMSLKPKTVTANTELSRKFILQSSLSAEQFARSELLKAMMLGIDLAAINGKGTGNEPTGILNTAGIGAVEIGANGGAPEWKHIVALESAIAAANADIGDLAYITNARVRGLLKTKLKADGVSGYIWQDGATPLNGYRCAVSNQIPSNLTKGTAANKCSPLIFGNWSDLMIAHWGVLDVIVDPYTKSTAGAVRITTLQDVDIAVRHVESFAAIKDIVAA